MTLFKKEKKQKSGNLNQLKQEDKINFIILEEGDDIEEYQKNNEKFEKFSFGEDTFLIHTSSEFGEIEIYSKDLISDYLYLAVYGKKNDYDIGYFEKDEDDCIVVLEFFDAYVTVAEVIMEEEEKNDLSVNEFVDALYQGSTIRPIEHSIQEIKDAFSKKSYKSLYLLIFMMIIFFAYAYHEFGGGVKVVKKAPPKPYIPPLTQVEKNHLSRAISLRMVYKIISEIEQYEKNDRREDLTRVIGLTLSGKLNIPPVQPYLVDNERWVYPPGPKRGGISFRVGETTQQVFAGVGYTLIEDDLYTKQENETFKEDENYFKNKTDTLNRLVLSEECLNMGLEIDGVTTPIKRKNDEIILKVEDVNGSTIKNEISPYIKECPIYIDNLSQLGERFNLTLILYKVHK